MTHLAIPLHKLGLGQEVKIKKQSFPIVLVKKGQKLAILHRRPQVECQKSSRCLHPLSLYITLKQVLQHVGPSQWLLASAVRFRCAGITTEPEKVKTVQDWESPSNLKQLQAFLGIVWYHQWYIPDSATVAQPFHQLVSKESLWKYQEETRQRKNQYPLLRNCFKNSQCQNL